MSGYENVSINVFDTDLLRLRYPEWDALDRDEKFMLLKSHLPSSDIRSANVTCTELHQWLAQEINPEIDIDDEVSDVALGTGGTTTSSSDTSLNNKAGEVPVSDAEYVASDHESHFSFFVDSTVLNGETLNELGLISNKGRFLNHAAIDPNVDKTSSKTLVIEVFIQFA